MEKSHEWNELAAQLCVDSIRASTAAGSGHPTSSMSAAHLLAVLFSDHLRYDVDDPKSPGNDRFILSKGHASPLLFSVFRAIGAISDTELLSFRKFGSPVQGHPAPVPEMPWVDVATGSLGQGLPVGLGMALAMRLNDLPGRVWVLMMLLIPARNCMTYHSPRKTTAGTGKGKMNTSVSMRARG